MAFAIASPIGQASAGRVLPRSTVLRTLVAVGVLGCAGAASADIIQIAGPAFVEQCPCGQEPAGEVSNGVLVTQGTNATYFAAVPFPDTGLDVCSFSLVYRDANNDDDMTARLLRKSYSVGDDAFANPVVMAKVSSSGKQGDIRIATTSKIKNRTVRLDDSFYYVEVDVVTFNLDFLGVKIDARPVCPPV
jgi:hypothetical protein